MLDEPIEAPQDAANPVDTADSAPTAESASSEDAYKELNNRYLRLAADFDNFRKRQAQERESLFKYGAQNTLETLLPVLDNLERAQKSLSVGSDPQMLFKSFEMLSQQLRDALANVGLEKMAPKGQPFDPELHEAVSQAENADVPDHTVIEVYQDGYRLRDRVLRHAQVVVSVQPAPGDSFKPETPGDAGNPFQQAGMGSAANLTEPA